MVLFFRVASKVLVTLKDMVKINPYLTTMKHKKILSLEWSQEHHKVSNHKNLHSLFSN